MTQGLTRQYGARTFDFTRSVAVMAIVNRTRDSFHDAGRTFALASAVEAALQAVADGADWVDIGGVPFSPLAEEVTEDEELQRVVPVIKEVRAGTDAVISVDTFRPRVAEQAVEAGATVINDTSGLRDRGMAEVAARTGAGLIVTHSKAAPREWYPHPHYGDVVQEVLAFLQERVASALDCGVAPDQLIVDPGHDLNKNTVHSLELTRGMEALQSLGHPVLASVSNKDFIAETLGRADADLRTGTVTTMAFCVLNGARILRVHDVPAAVQAVRMLSALIGWTPPRESAHNV